MPHKLAGKIAVVTGGATGIGFASAKRFAAEGARVFITGRRQAELDKAVAGIGENATGVQADSTKMANSLLVDGASVILTGSTASIVAMPAFSVYGASKAAVRSFARNWTLELKERRIRVNVLSPGPTKTPGLLGLAGDDRAAQQGLLAELASDVPLGRVADPDEIASVALFLASDDSSFITGVELFAVARRNSLEKLEHILARQMLRSRSKAKPGISKPRVGKEPAAKGAPARAGQAFGAIAATLPFGFAVVYVPPKFDRNASPLQRGADPGASYSRRLDAIGVSAVA